MNGLAIQQNPVDWDAVRLRYEVLGESFNRLALAFRIPVADIQALAQAENWTAIDSCTPENLDNYIATLFGTTQNKIHLLAIYRELTLMGEFHNFEDTLISKLQTAASHLDPYDKNAPRQLQALMAAYERVADRYSKISSTLLDSIGKAPKKTISISLDITES